MFVFILVCFVGMDPDLGDYDNRYPPALLCVGWWQSRTVVFRVVDLFLACATRCPIHLAAASGRLLAVTYLLGVCANPNAKDRWGGTPMDDCVRGSYDIRPYSSVKAY